MPFLSVDPDALELFSGSSHFHVNSKPQKSVSQVWQLPYPKKWKSSSQLLLIK